MTPDKNTKRPYSVEAYNPEWVNEFQRIKSQLQNVFDSKALSIEHIGSTSVPGMKAKPLIDVLIIVETIESFQNEKQKMISLQYQWGEDYIAPDTLIFYKTAEGNRKIVNIHVCEKDSFKAVQFVIMRDFLRTHPDKAIEYSNLKEKLSKQFPDDYPAYREAKHEFLDDIEVQAHEWMTSRGTEYTL